MYIDSHKMFTVEKNHLDPCTISDKIESLPNEARSYIAVLGERISGLEIS